MAISTTNSRSFQNLLVLLLLFILPIGYNLFLHFEIVNWSTTRNENDSIIHLLLRKPANNNFMPYNNSWSPSASPTALIFIKDYEDATPPRPHPHAGARFPNKTYGFIADPTLIRRRHIEKYGASNYSYMVIEEGEIYEYVCENGATEGFEKRGWELITDKVSIDYEGSEKASGIKLLCLVYTYEKRHHTQIKAVVDSWGWRCDGFIAASNFTEHAVGAVDIAHEGPEDYYNMYQKVRSMWAYAHDHYLDDFDYFWIGGDDVDLIVENLKAYLASITNSTSIQQPMYLGQFLPMYGGKWYCGGGPGYILNKEALKQLVDHLEHPECMPHKRDYAEDRFIGICFDSFGVKCRDTTDELGAQRFPGMDPFFITRFDGRNDRFWNRVWEFWGEIHGGIKSGPDIVAQYATGFHMLRWPAHLKRIHAILYNACPPDSLLGEALAEVYNSKKAQH